MNSDRSQLHKALRSKSISPSKHPRILPLWCYLPALIPGRPQTARTFRIRSLVSKSSTYFDRWRRDPTVGSFVAQDWPGLVTVAFPLPSSTPKSAIKVTFTPKSLSPFISDAWSESDPFPFPLPRCIAKQFWDWIRPSTSFWTWDKTGEKNFGLLTLHLDKQHEGTRWSQVFAAYQAPSGEPEPEVVETLDPSELYNIREALEKYRSSLSEDGSGLGLGQGVPSLGKGGFDDEFDPLVGREAVLTRIPVSIPLNQEGTDAGDRSPAVSLLSTFLPGSTGPGDSLSLITKNDIDGLSYILIPQKGPDGRDESTPQLFLLFRSSSLQNRTSDSFTVYQTAWFLRLKAGQGGWDPTYIFTKLRLRALVIGPNSP